MKPPKTLTSCCTLADIKPLQLLILLAIAGVIAKPFNPVTLGLQIANLLGWADS